MSVYIFFIIIIKKHLYVIQYRRKYNNIIEEVFSQSNQNTIED